VTDTLSRPAGVELVYRVDDFTDPWTEAKTVLLVHGFAESSEAWRSWVPHFLRRYRVVRYDQRGFGRSTVMPADFSWSLDQLADDLVQVITRVAKGPVHLVAAKIGGPVAIRAAVTRPDLVATLTLVGTPVIGPKAEPWIRQIEAEGPMAWARATMDARLGEDVPERAKAWWIELAGATAASTMIGFLRAAPTIDVRGDLPEIACPCLVLTTDSKRHPVAEVEGWRRAIPDSQLVLVAGTAYHAAAAHPDFCAEKTLQFIGRHD